jgi:hypothetical protein
LVAGGNRFDKAWRRSGVVPLGATGLSRAHPALFRTESAAREALRTFGNNGGVTQIIRYLGTPPIFSYRLPGQRGLSSRALIDCRHPHPRVALEEALASGVEDFHAEK